MKYEKFKEEVETELGFRVEEEEGYICIRHNGMIMAWVSRLNRNAMFVGGGLMVDDQKREELLSYCYQLATTPLEYRAEEKKYRVRHKYIRMTKSYLNCDRNNNLISFDYLAESSYYQTIFTEFELKKLTEPNFYRTLLDEDIYVWEEVSE